MLQTQSLSATCTDERNLADTGSLPASKALRRKTVLLVLAAALLVNAAMVLVGLPKLSSIVARDYSLKLGDLYNLIAINLDQGNGYRVYPNMGKTMLREPGYPLFLAGLFKLGGYGMAPVRLACVLLAFGAALLLARLTQEITRDGTLAVVAALLFLLYPGILVAETRGGIEIPSIFTVMLFILALHRAVRENSPWRYGAAGLLLGLAVMVRSEVLLFPALLLVYLLFVAKGWAERSKIVEGIAVLALGTTAVMSPWIIRNYKLVHSFVPTASIAGVSAQEGLYTCENTLPDETFNEAQYDAGHVRAKIAEQLGIPFVGRWYYQVFYTPQGELAFDKALLNQTWAQYRSRPEVLAGCAAKNLFFNFWFLGRNPTTVSLNVIVQAPLLALALAGIVVLWKRKLLRNTDIVLLYIIYVLAVHAVIIAHARHSMLVVPFLAIFAAASLVWIWQFRLQVTGHR